MKTALEAMRFGWVAYVIPVVFVVTPSLLLNGSWDEIVLNGAAAIAGVWLISMAAVGWMRGDISWPFRLGLGMSGAAFLWPDHIFFGSWHALDLTATALAFILFFLRSWTLGPSPTPKQRARE